MPSTRARPSAERARAMSLVEVKDLSVNFKVEGGTLEAVRRVSFHIEKGETLALVGESGSGKSVTALSIMQLLPYPVAQHPAGSSIVFKGEQLVGADQKVLRDVRGDQISMIFQEPMTSLNPLHTVEKQINETLFLHKGMNRDEARRRTLDLLKLVGIPDAAKRLSAYPHELSGGQRQRVMIAMALANEPDLLIADEPTTALDVTIQAQILELMRALRGELGTAIILITHDLGVVAELADDVIVMYAGRVIERAPVPSLFAEPQHPYTVGLLGSIPRLDAEQERLSAIEGFVPDAAAMPEGCRFHPRCPFAIDKCRREEPPLSEVSIDHFVSCWRAPL